MNPEHKRRLIKAAEALDEQKLKLYFSSREAFWTILRGGETPALLRQCRDDYSNFYRLSSRFVTKDEGFKQRYFQKLFSLDLKSSAEPYSDLLKDLQLRRERKGIITLCMQFSFVSKLVATHDDSKAIYDSNVRRFLSRFPGLRLSIPPRKGGNDDCRIRRFIEVLTEIQREYESWEPEFDKICTLLLKRIPKLRVCHHNKVWDFLVWTAGSKTEMGR